MTSEQTYSSYLKVDELLSLREPPFQRGETLCEGLPELDELLQKWRASHFVMVRRTLGGKMGSGGSSGTDYLASTLSRVAFPDLWDIRSELEYDNN